MRGSTKCFSIGDEGSMYPRRGREGRAGTFRSELTKVRKYGPHHRSRSENCRARLVGKMKCSSSSDKSRTRIQANGSAQTLTVSIRSSRSFRKRICLLAPREMPSPLRIANSRSSRAEEFFSFATRHICAAVLETAFSPAKETL